MTYYVVSFDRVSTKSYRGFHDEFVKNPRFKNWWHHIKSSYIISTEMTANEISDYFTKIAKSSGVPTRHFVMRVNIEERQGMLPKGSWAWFKRA